MMINKEEITEAIDAFNGTTISSTLEQYLVQIASTGITILQWVKIKPIISLKMDSVISDFQSKCPMDPQVNKSNMENLSFEEMKERLHNFLNAFTGIPFTIQRLCEMLTDKNMLKQYKMVDKFMRGIEKNLLVVTTVDPLGNRIVNESKLLMNGEASDNFSASTHENGTFLTPSPLQTAPSSWYTSLASVVDSPSSYPNWKHIRDDEAEYGPPLKMQRLEQETQPEDPMNCVDGAEMEKKEVAQVEELIVDEEGVEGEKEDVEVAGENEEEKEVEGFEVAPLLKQLLNCERSDPTVCDSTNVDTSSEKLDEKMDENNIDINSTEIDPPQLVEEQTTVTSDDLDLKPQSPAKQNLLVEELNVEYNGDGVEASCNADEAASKDIGEPRLEDIIEESKVDCNVGEESLHVEKVLAGDIEEGKMEEGRGLCYEGDSLMEVS